MKINYQTQDEVTGVTERHDVDVERKSFYIEDQFGNKWRLSDSDGTGWSFELTMVETSTGRLGSLELKPVSGNVIAVSPS